MAIDLMTYLFDEFNKFLDELKTKGDWDRSDEYAQNFVLFAREQLNKNPAVSVYAAPANGLGLKLADGTEVDLLRLPSINTPNQYMPVTTQPVSATGPDVPYTPSMPIFGGK